MLARIAEIVARFKQNWSQELEDDAIRRACQEAGHTWRDRKLDPVTTVRLFLLQILWGNVACNHVPHLSKQDVTGAAYCEARARLPLTALQTLLTRCTTKMAESVRETGRWLGHRLFIVDGSSFSMPDSEQLREHFGHPGGQQRGCGFPTAHWLALVHFGSGLFQKVVTAPLRTHDLSQTPQLHPELEAGDVLLGDRGFCSFAHMALLMAGAVQAILRIHQRIIVDFTPGRPHAPPRRGKKNIAKNLPRSRWVKSLGVRDQLVEWFKPLQCPEWMTVYNLVRMTMLEASRRQGVPPDRISFVDALRWLSTARPGDELPNLVVNPCRPGRQEPRVRKRRPKEYPVMKQPRAILKQRLAATAVAP